MNEPKVRKCPDCHGYMVNHYTKKPGEADGPCPRCDGKGDLPFESQPVTFTEPARPEPSREEPKYWTPEPT